MRGMAALAFFLLLAGAAPAFADPPGSSFVRADLDAAAVRLQDVMRSASANVAGGRDESALLQEGAARVLQNQAQEALPFLAGAVTAAPTDPLAWVAYARAAYILGRVQRPDASRLLGQAAAAAYASYRRATKPEDAAGALALLAEISARETNWRLALDAWRASLALVDDPKVRAAYEPVRVAHGFRITGYKIDSDAASPRACFQFSDPLARGKVDFAPFVAVQGESNAAISNEEQQLCVEGLKHGASYSITLRQGLPSAVGEKLLKNADYRIYVKDRSPQVHFTGRNYVLPRVGQEGIPLVSVNTSKIAVDILRIGDRNLLSTLRSNSFLDQLDVWRARQIQDRDGTKIWSGTIDAKPDLNKDVITAFPVLQAVHPLQPGLYAMVARPGADPVLGKKTDDADGQPATQWFVVSDLGLTALSGQDGMHVVVRSLATAQPVAGAQVKLVARDNEVLASATSDASGSVSFSAGLARGKGGDAPGLVTAALGDDYDFLDLQQPPFDLTDRGVAGRAAPAALDAMLFAERGVYRPGETVDVTALLRDSHGTAQSGLPLTLVMNRPDGVEYRRASLPDEALGGRAWPVALLAGVPQGTWRVRAYVDPKGSPVGETSFLVEDYVPERLDVTLTPQQSRLAPGEAARIETAARWLYGAPGAGLSVSGEVTVAATDGALPEHPGFYAGLQDESFEAVRTELEEDAKTDAAGHVSVEVPVPDVDAPRPVEARIALRVAETGGRAVERIVKLPIQPKTGLIGVKKNFSKLSEGATASFDVIALDAAGKRAAQRNVGWSLYRIQNQYQWYKTDGQWSFERVKSTRRIADGHLDVAADTDARIAAPVQWGAYRLDLQSADAGEPPTSIEFEVGWSGDATADTPDLLETTLDHANYRSGETMNVHIAARTSGKASLFILGNRLEARRDVDVKPGDNLVSLPASADWGTGAYAVAILQRPLDVAARRMPGRALGLAWFGIDQDAHRLAVAIDAPAKIEPRKPVTIPLRVAGLSPGEEAVVTVAAVDVGILDLTHYTLPDPTGYFFGQRQLGTEIRDLYGMLIDGMQGVRGEIRSGGDAGASLGEGNRPTQAPLALYSGLVRVGADGTARITFDIPAFAGTMRVMAVAWSRTRVGAAQADVVVRDPVVVQASLPRFLSLGDRTRLHVELANVDSGAGDYALRIDPEGPLVLAADDLQRNVRLGAGGHAVVDVPIIASGIGHAGLTLKLAGPHVASEQTLVLDVKSGAGDIYRRSAQTLQPGESLTVSSDLLAGLVPGTGSVSAAVSLAGIDVPALLQALDRYPYGCTEQITSRALPLLYADRLAGMARLEKDDALHARIEDAIARLVARQDASGAIGLWSADSSDDLWLDAYATDFLTRARENGYAVPQRAFEQALDHLRNIAVNAGAGQETGEPVAYALYVLARNGRAVMGDLRYLADTRLADFKTPLARAQIGAALALLGDRPRAAQAFTSAADLLAAQKPDLLSRPDYGSRLRDAAGLVALGTEADVDPGAIRAARLTLGAESGTARASTQEMAWMVLAAAALSKDAQAMHIDVGGVSHDGAFAARWSDGDLAARQITITNRGSSAVDLVLTTSGKPTVDEPAADQGYSLQRSFYHLDGTMVTGPVKQNERVVVVLKVTESQAAPAKLLLVDPLPAGLEIENPALFDGGHVEALAWLKSEVAPVHAEYRDDRFVAAFDRDGSNFATFPVAYIARAVTPGHYVLPPASVEDMYRPQRFGRTAAGTLDVVDK